MVKFKVITLGGARLEKFRCPEPCEVVEAYNGHQLPMGVSPLPGILNFRPRVDGGTKGCFTSHYKLWESQDSEWMCVIEDDCVFDEDFSERFWPFHRAVDELAGRLWYPGGHHTSGVWKDGVGVTREKPIPARVLPGMMRAKSVDRTHCYVIRKDLAKELVEKVARCEAIGPVDWWLRMYVHGTEPTYVPDRWMCAQNEGPSTISLKSSFKSVKRWELEPEYFTPLAVVQTWEPWMAKQPNATDGKYRTMMVALRRAHQMGTFVVTNNYPKRLHERVAVDVYQEGVHMVPCEDPAKNRMAWELVTGVPCAG